MTWWSNDGGAVAAGVLEFGEAPVERTAMMFDWQDLGAIARGEAAGPEPAPEVLEAQREAELEEAFQRGFREGEAAGRAQVIKEAEPASRAAHSASASLRSVEEEYEGRIRENLLALALAVARKVIEREAKADPGIVAELIEKALAHFPLDQKVRVRLHPADLAFIAGDGGGEQRSPRSSGREVRWIPDESLTRGGCLVEGPEHVVDGRLDTALERIYRTVFHD